MILTHAEHNSPYLAGSFSLSYRVQLKSEDLTIRENSKSLKQHLLAGPSVILTWHCSTGGAGGGGLGVGGCTQQIFIGRGPPLNLLYTIFLDIVYLLLTNVTPFTYLAQNFVSLLTAGKPHCPKIEINHKYRPLSRRVRVGPRGGASPYKYLLSTSPGFRAEPPRIGHHREYPLPWHSKK